MIAKLIVSGETRDEAIARADGALQRFDIEGLKTQHPAAPAHRARRAPSGRARSTPTSWSTTRSPDEEHATTMDVPAHITGTVWKIEVKVGQVVAAGDVLVILESMKMEMPVEAPEAGTVKEIRCKRDPGGERGRRAGRAHAVSADGRARAVLAARRRPGADAGAAAAAQRADPFLLDALAEALAPDPAVRALVLEARGPAFCAGYDLAQLGEDAAAARSPDARIQEVLAMLEAHPAPSVAVVHGAAFGAGCELACACDFRVGTPDTVLCMPPVRLGVVYAPDGVWRVARLAGLQRARWMFLTAAEVSATRGARLGTPRRGDRRRRGAGARAGGHAGLGRAAGDGGAPPDAAGHRPRADRPRRAGGARGAPGGGVRLGGRRRGADWRCGRSGRRAGSGR